MSSLLAAAYRKKMEEKYEYILELIELQNNSVNDDEIKWYEACINAELLEIKEIQGMFNEEIKNNCEIDC